MIGGEMRRKPLELLTGIFSRNGRRRRNKNNKNVNKTNNGEMGCKVGINLSNSLGEESDENESEEGDEGGLNMLLIPAPKEALHSPYHARTIDQDMENLRLSRQDNPFLQVLASRECLNESIESLECAEKEFLMSRDENVRGSEEGLSLSEVHARLVRSPPPFMWTRSRNSEPSFSHLITSHDTVFNFPPSPRMLLSPTQSTSKSEQVKFLSPGPFYSKRESALEALSGRFNLSPQPRRKPKDSLF